ncbi:TonB-dependent receptor [Paraglaciecola aquimarina]|uniref:TonB-dependent receptor n=1 Tax=Paraglaciecola aquimarina TaxID=1235557 RepID=A0ABU3SZY8_9ALTE|nr:TonB-dependent receptor [Paraglaciecola aquimarina]MDU0355575.1 TonB-dependent receptor [Paraglaciecola aquimarina]
MNSKFKLSALALALAASMGAYAQDAQTDVEKNKIDNEDEVEVIEVTGFASSLRKAINQKRFAENVIDTIHAEDIGKSTDQNIADALSRITGVSVQEQDGEGTRISVRGAASHLNQISLNGVALTSGLSGSGDSPDFNQSVDLSSFSSDILSSIDVIKTPSADHDEGSLGANVILRTVKPLSVKDPIRSFTVQGRYNDYSDQGDGKLSASFSNKFLDDTLGFVLTAATETAHTRSDSMWGNWNDNESALIKAGHAYDVATGSLLAEDTRAFHKTYNSYSLNLNQRDRKTATLGIQFLPTESTDVQLDLSYTKQDIQEDKHTISFNTTISNDDTGNLVDDPESDWYTIDSRSQILLKNTSRRTKGAMNRGIGGKEVESKVATLKIAQDITEYLRLDLTAGYSKTTDENLRNINAGTATWNTLNGGLDGIEGADVEPVGYDCTDGTDNCNFVFGSSIGALPPVTEDQRSIFVTNTQFNPFDLPVHHLSSLTMYNNVNEDTNKSLFADFDWDVEFGPIIKVEFGYKYSSREKDVLIDKQSLTGTEVPVFNADGQEIVSGSSPQHIRITEFLSAESFPVNNFMDDVAHDNFPLRAGWGLIDPEKALSVAFLGNENVALIPNPAGSKVIGQDNQSAYAKFNFELMDSRLTGNFGVRYVETEIEASSYTSVTYNNSNNNLTPYDLIYRKGLANTTLPDCDFGATSNALPADVILNGGCHEEYLTHLYDGNIAKAENWHPEWDENGILLNGGTGAQLLDVTYDASGNVVSVNRNDPFNSHVDFENYNAPRMPWRIRRWVDNSTNNVDVPSSNKYTGGEAFKNWQRSFATSGESKNEVWLPSFNLNYAVNEEVIARFAVSKTMARPNFNALTPGATINESIWGDRGWGRTGSASLKPLESKNLDLSIEWYFDKTGMLSFAYFKKNMSNFLQSVNDVYYWKDIREEYDLESIAVDELLIAPDGQTPADGCMPVRHTQSQTQQAFEFGCHELNVGVQRNGKSTTTEGIEIGYTDTFENLPGLLSGLGVNFNYTFQDSENDPEFVENTGTYLAPLPQAWTPRHSANSTVFWNKDGVEVRLAHRYTGVQFMSESATTAKWQDTSSRLDLSANYNYSKNVSFSFHALNLTDDVTKSFLTSKSLDLGHVDANGESVLYDEGNPMTDGDVDKSKIFAQFKTGRNFRISARVKF